MEHISAPGQTPTPQARRGPSRRAVMAGAVVGLPLGLAGAPSALAVPAVHAAPVPEGDTVSITVADPAYRTEPHYQPVMDTPVHRSDLRTRRASACLPRTITVHNGTAEAVHGVSGTVEVLMHDYDTDIRPPFGGDQLKIHTDESTVTLREGARSASGGSGWSFTHQGTLDPGQSLSIPLVYWVRTPFWNVRFQVLVAATLNGREDRPGGRSEKIGVSPTFTA